LVYPHVDPNFIVDDSINCNPLLARFTPDSNKVHVQWTWTFGDGASSALQKPSHLFENFTNNDDTFRTKLIVLSDNMCKDSLTKNIIVRGRIEAGFTVSPAAGCGGFTTTFHNASSGGIINYYWDFGEGTLKNWSAALQPDSFPKSFNNTDSITITDTVKLVVDNGYCTAPYTAYIIVHPNVIASFTYDKVKGCNPFTTRFINTSNKKRANQFRLNFGDGASSFNIDTVYHLYENLTSSNRNLMAKLTATSSITGCTDTDSIPVVIYKFIDADFNISDAHLCAYQWTNLQDVSKGGTGIAQRYWSFQGNYFPGNPKLDSLRGTSSFQYKYSNNTTDSINKKLKLYVRNDKFCYDSIIKPVVVYPHIALSFSVPATACDSALVSSFGNTTNAVAIYPYSYIFSSRFSS
jgi:PKD repeat protein